MTEKSSVSLLVTYPMLTDSNYGVWAVKMKRLMRALGVWVAIEGDAPVSEKEDQGALAVISQAIPDAVLMSISEKNTAKEAWEALKEMHIVEDRVKAVNVLILKREFDRMMMEENETISEFALKLTNTVNEIRSLGCSMEESALVEKLFRSVPDRFLLIIGIIQQWGDMTKMTLAEAVGRLKAFESTLKERRQEREGKQLLLTRAQWESLAEKKKRNGKCQ